MISKIRTAFILGAGLGTRLRPLTLDCPKPLLPVVGRPMICHALDRVVDLGVERVVINTHHLSHRYDEFFPERQWRGVPLIFRDEPVLLETGGGLKNIEDLILGETLLIYNGDVLASFDLQPLIEAHLSAGVEVTLGLRTVEEPRQVGWDPRTGWIRDIRGKRGAQGSGVKLELELVKTLFTGVYLVQKSFLNRLTPGKIESVVDVFLRMIESEREEEQGQLRGFLVDDHRWMDLGTLADYERVKESGI